MNSLPSLQGGVLPPKHLYTHVFDPIKIEKLVTDAFPLFEQLKAELTAFVNFLEQA